MYELKAVCDDPTLPADVPGQPQSVPELRVTTEKTDAGDWQGVIMHEGHEMWRGKPHEQRWQAMCDAGAAYDSIKYLLSP